MPRLGYEGGGTHYNMKSSAAFTESHVVRLPERAGAGNDSLDATTRFAAPIGCQRARSIDELMGWFTIRESSDHILEAKSEDHCPPNRSHGSRIQRSDVLHESLLRDRLNGVELHERVFRQVGLAPQRDLGRIALSDRGDLGDGELVEMSDDSLARENQGRPPSRAPAEIELPHIAAVHLSPHTWASLHASTRDASSPFRSRAAIHSRSNESTACR